MIEFFIGLLTSDWLPAIVGVVAGAVALLFARRSGKQAADNKQLRKRIKDMEEARDIERDADAMSDDEVIKEAGKWKKR